MLKRIALLVALSTLVATSLAFASGSEDDLAWQETPTGSTASLRGLSAVSENVAWASGSLGTVLRTTDRGATWQSVGPPGTEALQFRDIEAFDRRNAVILSIGGTPDAFRVYVTSDGGRTWQLGFQNQEPTAFYDCMTFFDRRHGLALSDPIGGEFRLIATRNGGRSWQIVDADIPPPLPGEFMFAASGQCLVSSGDFLGGDDDDDDDRGDRSDRQAWFGTGGSAVARVFRSRDGGESWRVSATPIKSGPTAGINALAFRDEDNGLAVGGDFAAPAVAPDSAALSRDGGRSWRLIEDAPNEYRSGATWVDRRTAIAVGLTGSDVSFDRGRSWSRFDSGSFHTVDCADEDACWASGANGRVAFLVTDD